MEYSADDLELPATDAIACRSRPSMYVGPVDSDECVSIMLQEAMCFALQGALDGITDEIQITKHQNGAVSIRDNGPDLNPHEIRDELPIAELLLTRSYACDAAREIDRSNFNFGIVSTNALSKSFVYQTTFDDSVWQQEFQFGIPLSPIKSIGQHSDRFRCITFVPDTEIILNTELSYDSFREWFDKYCGMIRGCQIDFQDEINDTTFEVANIAR